MRLFGRIGRRLLGWFLLVALIPLLFMGFQGYYFARRAVEHEVFLHMETVARAKQLAIEQWFEEQDHELFMLEADPLIVSGALDTASVRKYLEDVRWKSRQFAVISVRNSRGVQIIVPDTAHIVEPSWPEGKASVDYLPARFGTVYLNPTYGPAIYASAGGKYLPDKNLTTARVTAILSLSNSLNPIILDTTGLGQSGQAYLVDKNKVMLTPSRFMSHPAPLSHTMDTEGIRRALSGRSGSGVYAGFEGHHTHASFEGQQVLGAWAYLPNQEWALIAEMNADEAFAPLATLRRDAILVALATMGAVLIVVAWISRSISLPIRQLAEASLDVSRGNLDRTVSVRLNDELGELAESFNRMVNSLRESQRQLVQSERLAAIGELVASVVHEVRNPLSAIKMNLRILETKCTTSPVIAEHFALAKAQMERLEGMLKDLLDYSKPVRLEKHPVPIGELVSYAIRHLPDGAGDAKIETHLADANQTINVDAGKIEQVLLNLLLNAKQAITDGGRITISSRKDESAHMIFSIADNGQGISEENLKHIFEPFFTTRKNGTGLGLPNARKIVEAHGGQIHITSELHRGTEVHVELPIT